MQKTTHQNQPRESSLRLLLISTVSALIYIILTFLIQQFVRGESVLTLFQHGFNFITQIGIGVVCGFAGAFLIGFLLFRTSMSDILQDYRIINLVGEMRLSLFDRIHLSLFAGIGEELLFRGALQSLFGIWLTSVLFVAIHGYFKFFTIHHIIFGALMFALSVSLGFLFEWAGMAAAMTAHAVYDLVMLQMGYAYKFGKRIV